MKVNCKVNFTAWVDLSYQSLGSDQSPGREREREKRGTGEREGEKKKKGKKGRGGKCGCKDGGRESLPEPFPSHVSAPQKTPVTPASSLPTMLSSLLAAHGLL